MTITDEYLRMGGPVCDGWHFNASQMEHQLYGAENSYSKSAKKLHET